MFHRFQSLVVGVCLVACPNAIIAADQVKLHMSALSVESMPYLIAQDMGFYDNHEIALETHNMKVDIGVTAAVAGRVDATQILGLSLRGAIEQGADLRIVAVFNELPTYSLYVNERFSSIEELAGQRIASSSNGTSATKVLFAALVAAGLDPQADVNIFYMGDTPTRFQSLQNGAVEAAVLISPFDVAASKESHLKPLPFANEPGVLMAGMAANINFLEERPEVAQRFIAATVEGLQYFKANRDESIAMMVEHLNIDEDTAAQTYDSWIDRFTDDGSISPEQVDQVLNFEFGTATPEMAAKAFDFSIVNSLAN